MFKKSVTTILVVIFLTFVVIFYILLDKKYKTTQKIQNMTSKETKSVSSSDDQGGESKFPGNFNIFLSN